MRCKVEDNVGDDLDVGGPTADDNAPLPVPISYLDASGVQQKTVDRVED